MKEGIAHSIVAILSDKETQRFRATLYRQREKLVFLQILAQIRSQTHPDRSDGSPSGTQGSDPNSAGPLSLAPGPFSPTRKQYDRFTKLLLRFFTGEQPRLQQASFTDAAEKLIDRRLYSKAAEIIQLGITEAEPDEDYHLIAQLWILHERLPEPRPILQGCSYAQALAAIAILAQYQQMEMELRQIRLMEDLNAKLSAIAEIEKSPLLQSPGAALGLSARCLFWRLKAACHFFSQRYDQAIEPQSTLVYLLEDLARHDPPHQQALFKELGTLAILHFKVEDYKSGAKVLEEIEILQPLTDRAAEQRLQELYPAILGLAIDTGNIEKGLACCNDLFTTFEKQRHLCSPGFITQNLYYIAHFYISIGQIDPANKALIKLKAIDRQSFNPRIFAMYRLLEIVSEIEQNHLDDALRLIKNLRASKPMRAIPGINEGIQYLATVANALSQPDAKYATIKSDHQILAAGEALQDKMVLTYFNFQSWLTAKAEGRTMSDIFSEKHH